MTNAIIVAVALAIGHHSEQARWAALSLVESGNRDTARGRDGEVSRWQILKREWRRATVLPVSAATNTVAARVVCESVMDERVLRFELNHQRQPNDREWVYLWHCPAHVDHSRKDEREYADRFESAVKGLK